MNFNPADAWANILGSPLFWMYLVLFFLCATFVFRFARYSEWQSTQAGRAVMTLAASLTAVSFYATVWRALGYDWPYRVLVGAILIGGVILSVTYMLATLVRMQGGWRRQRRITEDDYDHQHSVSSTEDR